MRGFSPILFVFLLNGCTPKNNDDQHMATDLSNSIPLPAEVRGLNATDTLFIIDRESTLTDTMIAGKKHWKANGDMFFKIDRAQFPVYIYTSLMKLEVLEPSAFRVTAYDRDQGQSVESLLGKIKISKNYPSPFPEPDTLHEKNLYMVNKSIDLSEKEDLDDDKLSNWWNNVITKH